MLNEISVIYISSQVQLYMIKGFQIHGRFELDTYSYEGVKELVLILFFFIILIKLYGGMQCPTWLKPMTHWLKTGKSKEKWNTFVPGLSVIKMKLMMFLCCA